MKSILLVEDDPQISKLLELHLNEPEYQIICCETGEAAITKLRSRDVDLIILDILLPGLNGLEVCRQIREMKMQVPVLMLTSKAEESDKVLALELGADDYMTKPFGILELKARTRALIRRSKFSSPTGEDEVMWRRNLCIDESSRKVSLENKRIDLTPKEYELLVFMAKNQGKAFTRKQLLQRVWECSFDGYEHTVTAHINRLRIKIEPDINNPEYILTAWGIGYRFSDERNKI